MVVLTVAAGHSAADPDQKAEKLKAAMKDLFMEIDEDGNGELDDEELASVFEKIGVEVSSEDIENIMDACGAEPDDEGNKEVNFVQFSKWMMSVHPKAEALRHSFAALDDLVDDAEIAKSSRKGSDKLIYVAPGDPLQTVFVLLEEPDSGKLAKIISIWIQTLVVITTVTFVTETLEAVKRSESMQKYFSIIEWTCIVHFTAEYLTRVICCKHRPSDDKRLLSYIVEPMNLVDVLAVLPAYAALFFGGGESFAVIRVLRIVRIFRILKLGSFVENMQLIASALMAAKNGLLLLLYLVLLFMVIMSTVMYTVENPLHGNPEADFVDIPTTFWFTVVTMTSVGYGDMSPITPLGRLVASCIMLSGILTLAVPITLIGNKFHQAWVAKRQEKKLAAQMERMQTGDWESEEVVNRLNRSTEVIATTRVNMALLFLKQSLSLTDDDRIRRAIAVLEEEALDDTSLLLSTESADPGNSIDVLATGETSRPKHRVAAAVAGDIDDEFDGSVVVDDAGDET